MNRRDLILAAVAATGLNVTSLETKIRQIADYVRTNSNSAHSVSPLGNRQANISAFDLPYSNIGDSIITDYREGFGIKVYDFGDVDDCAVLVQRKVQGEAGAFEKFFYNSSLNGLGTIDTIVGVPEITGSAQAICVEQDFEAADREIGSFSNASTDNLLSRRTIRKRNADDNVTIYDFRRRVRTNYAGIEGDRTLMAMQSEYDAVVNDVHSRLFPRRAQGRR